MRFINPLKAKGLRHVGCQIVRVTRIRAPLLLVLMRGENLSAGVIFDPTGPSCLVITVLDELLR